MGHSLRSTNMTIDGSLSIYGGQGDKKILVSDARGQATWASASLFVDSKPESHYIGELFGGGVVVDVWKEGEIEKCLVAGPECISTVTNIGPIYGGFGVSFNYGFSWSSAWSNFNQHGAPQIDIGAKSPYFGASNSALISASYSHSAARRCEDYVNPNLDIGVYEDWFLPSIGELKCLFDNAAIFNRVLSSWAASNSWLTRDRTRFSEIEILVEFGGGPEISTINEYLGYDASNINLLEFGSATRWTRQTSYTNTSNVTTIGTVFDYSNDSYFPNPAQPNVSGGGYWSSTDLPGEFPLSISTRNLASNQIPYRPSAAHLPTSPLYTVRPFRIADDTQKFIPFDADWAIITYTFDGDDLDTKTRMVFPTAGVTPFTQSTNETWTSGSNAYSSNWIGYTSARPWYKTGQYSYKNFIYDNPNLDLTYFSYDYTPGITSSIPAPAGRYNPPGIGNNVAGTFSILLHSHDNQGSGKESVVVNLNAFKLHFPGQSTIEVECRAWWFGGNIGKNCNIDIILYKGGTISREVPGNTGNQGYYRFINTGHSASYSVSSYPVFVPGTDSNPPTPTGSAGWQIATKFGTFRYNVVGKYGSVTI